jgi:hypothetical protein
MIARAWLALVLLPPRTKLFGGYPMLQALFMNDVNNLLPGVLRPQLPKVPFLRSFRYGIDEITRPQDSLVCLCLIPEK